MISAATARTGSTVMVTLHKNKLAPNDTVDFIGTCRNGARIQKSRVQEICEHVAHVSLVVTIHLVFFFGGFSSDEYHTLIMVDPDVPFPTVGTSQRPLIHWLVINAPRGNIHRGTELHSYKGPRPPNKEPHTYYFLLYKHNSGQPLNIVGTEGYTSGCDR